MANFQITNKALEDLASIWDYTLQEWSAEQAEHYYNILLNNASKFQKTQSLVKAMKKLQPA